MYNPAHGLENNESGGLRRLRPHLDTAGGAPSSMRQSEVPVNPMG
jgi:hypothetical protein